MDSLLLGKNNSRSNSPVNSENNTGSSPDSSANEILNSLSLNDALTRSCLNISDFRNDLDLANLQNLQAIQALKYSQQSPALLNTLFNSTYSQSASQVKLEARLVYFSCK